MEQPDLIDRSKALVLIVDDNPQNLQLLGKVLKDNNYKLAVAQNGQQAIDFVSKKLPDIILMDVMMPGIDGIDACRQIKLNPDAQNIPVIFLTGLTDSWNKTQAFDAGGVDYVTKPFVKEELLARVEVNVARKLAEDELRTSRNNLKKINQELEKAIATKDMFFSIMAHDIKNPLWATMGCAETLAKEVDDFDKDEIRELSDVIFRSSTHLMDLLENLLLWSKTQTGTEDFKPQTINLYQVVTKACNVLTESAKSKNIQIHFEIEEDLTMNADENMITTIIRNLVQNGIKFTHHGGSVKVSAKNLAEHLELKVTDSGVGMKPESVEKLFKIEAHHSTKGTDSEKGTGLGLILCKEFVDQHKGSISVQSELNVGTTFALKFPQ